MNRSRWLLLLFPVVSILSITLWVVGQTQPQAGYTVLTTDAESSLPAGSALFTYTNSSGIVVSQTGVGATEPIRSGRMFVDEVEKATKTGVALVNPSAQPAVGTLILRDAEGVEIERRPLSLAARSHQSWYVSQMFTNQTAAFTGSLTFESNQPLAAITLRESGNALGEPLYSTLPVVDLGRVADSEPIVFPQIATGGGYTTQLILINSGSQRLTGRVRLVASDGQPMLVRAQDSTVAEFTYQIASQGTYRVDLDGVSGLVAGYAVVTPDTGSSTPAGTAVFRFKSNGQLTTEAGVAAVAATTRARILVDYIGAQTGFAVANVGDLPAELTLTLMDRYGFAEAVETRTLPPRAHLSSLVHELFPAVTDGYAGLLEIQSATPIVPITLKITLNARNDTVLTTLPVADLTRPPTGTVLIFPHIVVGGGFSTRLIFLNASTSNATTGSLAFYQSDGSPMVLPMAGQLTSMLAYQIVPGGGRQVYPGNSARVAGLALLDAASGQTTRELVINEGNTVRPRLRILDSTGARRDDFDVALISIDRDVAEVDALGGVRGKKAGFSTLAITADGIVSAATASVVAKESAPPGLETPSGTSDLSGRLYLAATQDHIILFMQDLKHPPDRFAGMLRNPGFTDGARLQAMFHNPGHVTLNPGKTPVLYVSDGANHVIRQVTLGEFGRVDTLAGTGSPGSQDGPGDQATFNNPQGIALDNRGNLWVVDSGNHTIRRIRLTPTVVVETIAGLAGSPGSADGKGSNARFDSPLDIALETESAVQELVRGSTAPPPPLRLLVADTGNGVIRRITEGGEVSTLAAAVNQSALPAAFRAQSDIGSSPTKFNTPSGVAVDPAGNIYVVDSGTGRVQVVLRDGSVTSAGEANSFSRPRSAIVKADGGIVVFDTSGITQIRYGEPRITTVSPVSVSAKGGDKVTIRGGNFSPETSVVVSGLLILDSRVLDTQTITFTMPPAPSGLTTVTVQNRGGLTQTSVLIEPIPLTALPAGYITTVAGGSTFVGDGRDAQSAAIATPTSLALDSAGNLYIASNSRVRKVAAATGLITTLAGNGTTGFSGDNGPATAASLDPFTIAVDPHGNLFIADPNHHRIRRVDASSGVISTVAGNGLGKDGQCGGTFSGDGGPASLAGLNTPYGVATDFRGNLFIADECNSVIRRVDAQTGIISTVAGNGRRGLSGDGGPALMASLNSEGGLATDVQGNLFIADLMNFRVRKVDFSTGLISTVAGSDFGGYSDPSHGDNGPATAAALLWPQGIAFDQSGNMFVTELGNSGPGGNRVRKIATQTGIITTIAGNGVYGYAGDGSTAVSAAFRSPHSIVIDAADNIFIADTENSRVRTIAGSIIRTIAGTGDLLSWGDGGPAAASTICDPFEIAIDSRDNIFISDYCGINLRTLTSNEGVNQSAVRRIDKATGTITRIPGTAGAAGLAVDSSGNLFMAVSTRNQIQRIDIRSGAITTVAGNGAQSFSGDGGPAISLR